MKKKISRILGVVLTLALLSSLAIVSAPVSAGIGDDDNAWGAIGMPAIAPETEVGVMAIAPDGTIYAAVFYEGNYATATKQNTWDIMKSTDGGFNWTATELTGLRDYDGNIATWDTGGRDRMPVDIVVAADGTTIYVACINGDIFRLEDAGDATPVELKDIVDSSGNTPDSTGSFLYDIDVWNDGSSNWILAACDLDVLVLEDTLFGFWRDQQLAAGGVWGWAVQADFAPDFDTSGLIWAAVDRSGELRTQTYDSIGTAVWSRSAAKSGTYSALLGAPAGFPTTGAGHVVIPYGQPLSTITDLGFWYNLKTGNAGTNNNSAPYLILALDTTSDGTADTWIVHHMVELTAFNTWMQWTLAGDPTLVPADMYGETNMWHRFPGDVDLASWTAVQAAFGADTVLEVKVCVGEWASSVLTEEYVDDITINGITYDLEPFHLTSTISPGQWGNTIKDVVFKNQSGRPNVWTPYVDIAFPDNYTSTAPMLYVAIAENIPFADEGNLYMVQGALVASTALTEADPLLPADIDVGSVEVSGNVILLVDTWSGDVWVSYNAGDTFALAVRGPSGPSSFWGLVYMAPGAFDPDEGVAYFTSIDLGIGQSAVSRTDDGGTTWDQISRVDTYIDNIWDVAFSPEGASQPALLLTGDNTSSWPYIDSLWQTADAAAASPQWVRVATNFNLAGVDYIEKVEYALDGSAIMLFVDDGDWAIYKSTDDANTFTHWRDLPDPVGYLNDWVVANSATIYTACTGGYYGTSIFGPATLELLGDLNSVAVDGDTIVVGGSDGGVLDGMVVVSIDAGENWGTPASVGAGDVFVTFGPDGTLYAATSESEVQKVTLDDDTVKKVADLEDSLDGTAEATSFSGIWVSPDNAVYAIGGDTITNPAYDEPAEVSGTIDLWGDDSTANVDGVAIALQGIDNVAGTFVDAEALTIAASTLTAVSSTIVSGTIYLSGAAATGSIDVVIFTAGFDMGEGVTIDADALLATVVTVPEATVPGDTDLFRLLIGEDDNVWETAEQDGAMGLWGTTGTNIPWTVVDGDELWALEDTLSGPVTGVVVSAIGENSAKFSWTAIRGDDLTKTTDLVYEVMYDSARVETSKTSVKLTGLSDDKEYEVVVRVHPQPESPFSSRWSSVVTFATLETILAPVNRVPYNGMQDAPLLPSFVWEAVSNAEYYEFQLSTSPIYTAAGFTSTVEVAVITAPTTAYTCTTELAYDTNHYWIVRAVSTDSVSGIDAVSDWCFSNFHTMVEAIPPVTIEPQPTPTITVIQPTPTVIVNIPDIEVIVEPPDITVDLPTPTITTVHTTIELPPDVAPAYIWVIVAIGALLVIAVITLIIRTRRVV